MKYLFLLVCLSFGTISIAQTLSDARNYFSNYEYDRAAAIFKVTYDKNGLEEEDLKKLVYSYYVTGDYTLCQPLAQELLSSSEKLEPMFYLVSGDANRGIGNYSKAINAYESYKSNDGEENVEIKIESCRKIVNWDDEEYVSFAQLSTNGKMADLSGGLYNGQIIRFQEIGFDNMQELLGVAEQSSSSFAELLLTQPSMYINDEFTNIFMKDSSMASVTSIAFMPNSNKVLLTIAYPLSKAPLERAPNLYWAKLTEDHFFNDVRPFDYSGLKDTSSTAHATINTTGNTIIFTKASERTKGADLYKTELKEGSWSKPEPLNRINSEGDEMFPLFQGDSVLTFSSDGRIGYGGLDIYSVQLPVETGKITHFKNPINSFKDDFNITYLTKDSAIFVSNRNNGSGDDDLYSIAFKSEEVPVDTFNTDDFIVEWKTKNVYFDFDKFTLNKTLSAKNIKELNTLFEKCSTCLIELKGFTDSRGSSAYNQKLSVKRAKEVEKVLKEAGFKAENIDVIGKGETDQPFDCGDNCSNEQHKLNRVVQINVIKR
jgi:outer membrane protein OmpA-like peptidoglycan-associated protein